MNVNELGPLTSVLLSDSTIDLLSKLYDNVSSLEIVFPLESVQSQALKDAEVIKKKPVRRNTTESIYPRSLSKGRTDVTAKVRPNGFPKRYFSVFLDVIVIDDELLHKYMEENLEIKLYLNSTSSSKDDDDEEEEEDIQEEEEDPKTASSDKIFNSKQDSNFYFAIEKQKTIFAVLDISQHPRFNWLPILCREKLVKLAAIPNGDPKVNDDGEVTIEFQFIIHIEKKAILEKVDVNLDDFDETLLKNPIVLAWQKLFSETVNKKRASEIQLTPQTKKRRKLSDENEPEKEYEDEEDDDMDEYLVDSDMEDEEVKKDNNENGEINIDDLMNSLTETVDEADDNYSVDSDDEQGTQIDVKGFLGNINYAKPQGLRRGHSLRPHQQHALKWMLNRELSGSTTSEAKLHPQFRRILFPDQTEFFYCAQRGILTFERVPAPPEPPGGILADEMGLGKTLETISVFLTNKGNAPVGARDADGKILSNTTLVICPLSVIGQWQDEIERFTYPPLKVLCFQGSRRDTDTYSITSYDVVITTYQTLAKEYSSHLEARTAMKQGRQSEESLSPMYQIRFHRVCLDEAHTIKNRTSQQHKACCYIEADKRWALTGTPIQNHVDDIFALFSFLRMNPHGEWEWWLRNISRQYQNRNKIAISNLHSIMKTIMLRRTKKKEMDGKSLLELPEKFVHQKELTFSQAEQSFYQILETMSKQSYIEIQKSLGKQGDQNFTGMLELISIMRQMCCHPALLVKTYQKNPKKYMYDIFKTFYDLGQHTYERLFPMLPDIINKKPFDLMQELRNNWRGSTKIDALCEQISELPTGTQAVVFSQWTSLMDIVEIGFERNGIRFVRLDGSMNRTKRENNITRFKNDATIKVGLISLKAGGVGLNLAWASYVFLIDPWWNPAVEAQAIDRVHRMGSKKEVNVVRFAVKGTIETRILNLQRTKGELANDILGDDFGDGTTSNLVTTKKKKEVQERIKEIGYLVGSEEYEFEEESDHENEPYY